MYCTLTVQDCDCVLQESLLAAAWKDLFLLWIGQMDSIRFEASDILKCAGLSNDDSGGDTRRPTLDDVNHVRDVVMSLRALHMDTTEYACLKAVLLFRPGTNTNYHQSRYKRKLLDAEIYYHQ